MSAEPCRCAACLAAWAPPQAFGLLEQAFGSLAFALDRTGTIAFGLFETDPEVVAFVRRVTDGREVAQGWALSRAWDRDEMGKRTFWLERARQTIARVPWDYFRSSATHARAHGSSSDRVVSATAFEALQVSRDGALRAARRAQDRVDELECLEAIREARASARYAVPAACQPRDKRAAQLDEMERLGFIDGGTRRELEEYGAAAKKLGPVTAAPGYSGLLLDGMLVTAAEVCPHCGEPVGRNDMHAWTSSSARCVVTRG